MLICFLDFENYKGVYVMYLISSRNSVVRELDYLQNTLRKLKSEFRPNMLYVRVQLVP